MVGLIIGTHTRKYTYIVFFFVCFFVCSSISLVQHFYHFALARSAYVTWYTCKNLITCILINTTKAFTTINMNLSSMGVSPVMDSWGEAGPHCCSEGWGVDISGPPPTHSTSDSPSWSKLVMAVVKCSIFFCIIIVVVIVAILYVCIISHS